MEIGIIGLPQAGKKTLFNLLTSQGLASDSSPGPVKSHDPHIGISQVYDQRLYKLAEMYKPKKVVPAVIKYILLPGLSKNSEENRKTFKSISSVDAVCHIVRGFRDETIFHIDGTIDPVRDIEYAENELLLNDLIFTESHLERLEKEIKRKHETKTVKELELIKRIQEYLNNETSLRLVTFTEEEKKMINAYPYLTRKNILIALNADENDITDNSSLTQIQQRFSNKGMHCAQVSCKIEMELAQIEDEEERSAFLRELGIKYSALEKITQLSYKALDRLSFFTVGKDEVRAWTVRENTTASQAGGVVHSDIERGFIRAEHMRVEDLLELGSEAKIKEAGKLSLHGKNYIVRDGDILHFRFNV